VGPALGAGFVCALLWYPLPEWRSKPVVATGYHVVRRAATTTELPAPAVMEPEGNAGLAPAEREPVPDIPPRVYAAPTLPSERPAPMAQAQLAPPRRQEDGANLAVEFELETALRMVPAAHRQSEPSGADETPALQATETTEPVRTLTPAELDSPWPETSALWSLCETLRGEPAVESWVQEVFETVEQVRTLRKLSAPEAAPLLARLDELARDGELAAESQDDRRLRRDWLRAAYAVQRRAKVWSAVQQALTESSETFIGFTSDNTQLDFQRQLAELQRALTDSNEGQGWADYLLLDDLADTAALGNPDLRQQQAQRCLMRLDWSGLTASQREFLGQPMLIEYRAGLLRWATDAVDYQQLLEAMERQEREPLSLESQRLATKILALRYSAGEKAPLVSDMVDEQYRNANLRLAIHAELLNRLLPNPEPRVAPVRQTILGADVRGTSRTESELDVRLEPHPAAWQVRVNIDGRVSSRTRSRSGPAELWSNGRAAFTADRLLRLDQDGTTTHPNGLIVDSHNKINELRTDFDGLPLLGDLVREIAWQRYQQQRNAAKAESEALISAEVQRTIDQELTTQLQTAQQQFNQQLLGPLTRLQLDPQVIDLQTTSQRLVARYRLASPWQLAATTPRPRAPNSSWLSVQLHQSAINNAFAGLRLSDQALPLPELVRKLLDTFEQQAVAVPEDVPPDIKVQFAPSRPITVEVDDDRLWLTLRIVRLNQPGRIDLRYFIIRAPYQPQVDGLDARLVREGTLQISGPRLAMGDRLALRTIFNKVLARDRELPLISQRLHEHPVASELEVGQFELRDGWLALALQPRGASQILRSEAMSGRDACPPESGENSTGEIHPGAEESGG
jgi:hypothetical protein